MVRSGYTTVYCLLLLLPVYCTAVWHNLSSRTVVLHGCCRVEQPGGRGSCLISVRVRLLYLSTASCPGRFAIISLGFLESGWRYGAARSTTAGRKIAMIMEWKRWRGTAVGAATCSLGRKLDNRGAFGRQKNAAGFAGDCWANETQLGKKW